MNTVNYFCRLDLLNKFKYLPLVISFDSSTPSWYAISWSSLTLEINPAVVNDASSASLNIRIIITFYIIRLLLTMQVIVVFCSKFFGVWQLVCAGCGTIAVNEIWHARYCKSKHKFHQGKAAGLHLTFLWPYFRRRSINVFHTKQALFEVGKRIWKNRLDFDRCNGYNLQLKLSVLTAHTYKPSWLLKVNYY